MHSDAVQLCGATFFLFLARHSIYVKYVGVTRLALYFFMYCTLLYSMVLTMATERKKEKFLLCLFRLSFHLDSFLWKYLEIDFIPKTTHFLLRWHCKVVTHIFFLPYTSHSYESLRFWIHSKMKMQSEQAKCIYAIIYKVEFFPFN